MSDNKKTNKNTSYIYQVYLINIALLFLIGYLVLILYQSHNPVKPKIIPQIAKLNDYGQPAFIGRDLKYLLNYDVKIPFTEGDYVLVELGGHIIFTLDNLVEVSLKDKVLIQFRKDGLDLLEGEITIQHPSGKIPNEFHVYKNGKILEISASPTVIQ